MPLLIGGGTAEDSVLFPPAAFAGVAASPPSPSIIFGAGILIEPAGVLGPLDVQPESAEVGILQGLSGLLGAPLAFELHKRVSFLLEAGGTLRSILQFPKPLNASSNYWCVTFLDTLPMNRLIQTE